MEHVSFKDLGLAVAIVILAINPIVSLVNVFRTQRRIVTPEAEYATRAALEEVRGDVQIVDGKVETLRSDIVKNGEARRQAIEEKVEEARKEARDDTESVKRDLHRIGNQVAALESTARMINQNMGQLALGRRDK